MTSPVRRRVLLATANPAKQDALRRLLAEYPVESVTPDEIGLTLPPVSEDGFTFQENAEQKAIACARMSGLTAAASDGGLEVPALGSRWDGMRSRRFAGPTDADRIAAFLGLLEGVPPERRVATFHEAVALSEPDGRLVASAQAVGGAGRIATAPDHRSQRGFWVPSLWLYPPRWVTEWDLTDEERSTLRTAWDAVADALRPALQAWMGST